MIYQRGEIKAWHCYYHGMVWCKHCIKCSPECECFEDLEALDPRGHDPEVIVICDGCHKVISGNIYPDPGNCGCP